MVRRIAINNSIEENIIMSLIVSDKVCRDVIKMIKRDSFVNPYSQKIASWVQSYYKKYHKAPGKSIQDIYITEKLNLKEEEGDFISAFLAKLSIEFEKNNKLNEDYLIDKATEYFKKRSLKNISEQIQAFVEIDDVDKAEKALNSYRQISKESSRFINPFSDDAVKKYFEDTTNNVNNLFRMPGDLGHLIGDFERGTLVGVMAPSKRGKSFFLMEVALQAFFEKCRVVFVSLEMNSFKMERRILKRLTAFGNETKEYVYPCFDCLRNQTDTCLKSIRTNHIKLRHEDEDKPDFDPNSKYQPCVLCRGKKDFIAETWFHMIKRPKQKLNNTLKTIQGIRQMYDENFRLICYPKFSANVSNIKSAIEHLEWEEGFIPDVIVLDYADILAPEDNQVTGRDRYDDTWKMLGNLADTRNSLVVTASQTNRASFNKKNVTQTDAAEDIRKIANVDVMIALNQLPSEKENGILRVSVVAERDDDFNQYKTCTILQNLALGQICLDSELLFDGKK